MKRVRITSLEGRVRTPRFNPLELTSDNKSVMAFDLSYLFDEREILAAAIERLMELVARGEIHAHRCGRSRSTPSPTRIERSSRGRRRGSSC